MPDFMDIFEKEYAPKLGIRTNSFRQLIALACRNGVKHIVETGSLRDPGSWQGDGQSTFIFYNYAVLSDAKFVTIDKDKEAIANVIKYCPDAVPINGDSVEVLSQLSGPVDLLYLDASASNGQAHCLLEYIIAIPILAKGCIVCADDSPNDKHGTVHGKGAYLAKFLEIRGFKKVISGYQTAWVIE